MYYLFEMHDSDGNDNSITDVIVTANSKDQAFDVIARSIDSPYADSGLGDEDLAIYEYFGDHAEDCSTRQDEDNDCDCEPILYSSSFYFQSEHDTLLAAMSRHFPYHGGIVYLGEETELETEEAEA